MSDVAAMKAGARTMWASGNYDAMVGQLLPMGEVCAEAAGAAPGIRLLDVAAGSGNTAVAAARRGAQVVASDLTPELFEAGRRRAAEAQVAIEWVEADAEDLPFDDGGFDAVTSTVGVMFAPRQSVAAAELARVTRPGGRLALCSWAPDGYIGRFFALTGEFLGGPPPVEAPPTRWGTEAGVRELLGDAFELRCEERTLTFSWPSIEEMEAVAEENFGPTIMARAALEPAGRWPEYQEAARRLAREWSADASRAEIPATYLLVTGTRR
ncbi:MAG TPA: methyltransferase domain-containing protein [Baekduia sp.]|nr:methyltransferase domain-containing protein [Baekduia sp.]